MIARRLYSNLLYPAYHALKGDGINEANKLLSGVQWWNRDALEQLQRRKLEQLLRFASEHVPYYSDVISQHCRHPERLGVADAFRRLPILTKDFIRREGERLQADSNGGRRGYKNSTSGSTGEPLQFMTDVKSHAFRAADTLRGRQWTGFSLGDRSVALWGAQMDISRYNGARGRVHGIVTGHRALSSYDLSPERMDDYIRVLERFRPQLLTAYPSALEVLARHCLERNAVLPPLSAGITTSAETLWDHQRALFEQVFTARIFNRYGSREVGPIAHECREHCGLHVSADRLIVEVVDEHGEPCDPGEWGELLVTDLESHVMPLIRYRIADRGVWSTIRHCDCGRGLPLLASVEGRSMDVITTASGRSVGGTFWTILLRSRPGVQRFQVVQNANGNVTIRYVPDSNFERGILAHFTREIHEYLGEQLPVEYQHVDDLQDSQSGKQRLIISKYRPS